MLIGKLKKAAIVFMTAAILVTSSSISTFAEESTAEDNEGFSEEYKIVRLNSTMAVPELIVNPEYCQGPDLAVLNDCVYSSDSAMAFSFTAKTWDSSWAGVQIWMSTSEDGDYEKITSMYTTPDGDGDCFDEIGCYGAGAKVGDVRYFKARSFKFVKCSPLEVSVACEAYFDEEGNMYIKGIEYSNWSDVVAATVKPTVCTGLESYASANAIEVSWSSNSDREVDKYEVYRATSENGTYKKVKTIKNNTQSYWTDTNVKLGKTYYYKVCSVIDGVKGDFTIPIKVTAKLAAPEVEVSSKKAKTATLNLYWGDSDADGYKVYRSTSKNGTYKCVKTIKGATDRTWTDTGVKAGKTYYYKVRHYMKTSGKTYYSDYTAATKVKVKK